MRTEDQRVVPTSIGDKRRTARHPYVSIEGVDGAGKSTVVAGVRRALQERNINVISPGQHSWLDPQAAAVLIASREGTPPDDPALIVDAYRRDLVNQQRHQIGPGVRGATIVQDRSPLSTIVQAVANYGAGDRQASEAVLRSATVKPDLVVFLEVDVATAVGRIGCRGKEASAWESEVDIARLVAAYRRLLSVLDVPVLSAANNDSTDLDGLIIDSIVPAIVQLHDRSSGNGSDGPTPSDDRSAMLLGRRVLNPGRACWIHLRYVRTALGLPADGTQWVSPLPSPEAINLIEATGLGFIPELALGVTVERPDRPPESDPEPNTTVVDEALAVLARSGRRLLELTARADRIRDPSSTGSPPAIITEALELSLHFHLLDRLGPLTAVSAVGLERQLRAIDRPLAESISALAGFTMIKDLVCVLFPWWPIDSFAFRNMKQDAVRPIGGHKLNVRFNGQ